MVGVWAAKAKSVTASTLDSRNNLTQIFGLNTTFKGVGAVWGRTPLKVVLVFDIGSVEKLLISARQRWSDENIERGGVENAATSIRGTLDPSSLTFLADLLC